VEKSGLREGIAVVSMLEGNSAIVIGDESLRADDTASWLGELTTARVGRTEAATKVASALLQHQIVVPFTEARLDLGPQQSILFVELEGNRPRRIVVKILGE
jgi:thiamine phosphate synthase YjbQ (UPF0047 family)